jgi:hypothetical protein
MRGNTATNSSVVAITGLSAISSLLFSFSLFLSGALALEWLELEEMWLHFRFCWLHLASTVVLCVIFCLLACDRRRLRVGKDVSKLGQVQNM